MMFLVRGAAPTAPPASVEIKLSRHTPAIVGDAAGKIDYFCLGTPQQIAALRAEGREVVELRDGWYEDDTGGGVAISGHGKYWEIRDTRFTIKESVGPAAESAAGAPASEHVNVRQAIFGV